MGCFEKTELTGKLINQKAAFHEAQRDCARERIRIKL